MRITGNTSYSDFKAVLVRFGTPAHVFYRKTASDVTRIDAAIDRDLTIEYQLDPVVSESTFLTDFPDALNIAVNLS